MQLPRCVAASPVLPSHLSGLCLPPFSPLLRALFLASLRSPLVASQVPPFPHALLPPQCFPPCFLCPCGLLMRFWACCPLPLRLCFIAPCCPPRLLCSSGLPFALLFACSVYCLLAISACAALPSCAAASPVLFPPPLCFVGPCCPFPPWAPVAPPVSTTPPSLYRGYLGFWDFFEEHIFAKIIPRSTDRFS